MNDENDKLHWHALNYRTAAPQHAEKMWQALTACVERKHAAETRRRMDLQAMLREVGRWDFRGRSVSEEYDRTNGAGSWRRALRA
jgi:hypothetical protein